jgi:hypothetical protein
MMEEKNVHIALSFLPESRGNTGTAELSTWIEWEFRLKAKSIYCRHKYYISSPSFKAQCYVHLEDLYLPLIIIKPA